MSRDKQLTVFHDSAIIYNIPDTPDKFLQWWKDKFDLVPEEYRHTAKVDLDITDHYGSCILECSITYVRPETKEEETARLADEQRRDSATKAKELNLLQVLKTKYGEV